VVNVDIAKQWPDRLWTLLDFKHNHKTDIMFKDTFTF